MNRTRGHTFVLEREQLVRRPLEEVFEFFADPLNLEAITPPWLHFQVDQYSTLLLQKGTTIDYRLRIHGIPIRWRSLISEWRPPFEFVDQQITGPYKLWVHRHSFTETVDGVLIRDRIEYAVPGGRIVNRLFVRNDLSKIFDYREASLTRSLPDHAHSVVPAATNSLRNAN